MLRVDIRHDHDRSRVLNELTRELKARGRSAIFVFEGADAAGKGGAIRRLTAAMDARLYEVKAVAAPTDEERAHPYLWRFWRVLPRRGHVTIYDRSWYGRVLVERIEGFASVKEWQRGYDEINAFERMHTDDGTTMVKFFLHISKDEQKKRLEARINDPVKNWKMEPGDLAERKHWDDYMQAYSDAISRCNTEDAPWYVIPADKKWFRNLAISNILVETLEDLKLRPPKAKYDVSKLKVE